MLRELGKFISLGSLNKYDKSDYDTAYGHWGPEDNPVPIAATYRIAWREFADTGGFRTLYPALIPPGTKHVNAVNSCWYPDDSSILAQVGAVMSSFLSDYYVRSAGTGHIFNDLVRSLAFALAGQRADRASYLYLRLNCLTAAYSPLWEEITGKKWTVKTPLRTALERRQAQNEIDALVALSLGVNADELCMIYRTQFPVMRRYDQQDLFDASGRKVPKAVSTQAGKLCNMEELSIEARTWQHPQSGVSYYFELPFNSIDREAELRQAFVKFSQGETVLE